MSEDEGLRPHGEQRPVVVARAAGSPGRSLAVLAALGILIAGAVALAMRGTPSEHTPTPPAEGPPVEALPAPSGPAAAADPIPDPSAAPRDLAPVPEPVASAEPAPVAVDDPAVLRTRMQALLPAGMQVDTVRVSGEVVFATGRAPRNAVVSDGLRALDAAAQARAPDAPRVELLSVRMDASGVEYEVRVPVAALGSP